MTTTIRSLPPSPLFGEALAIALAAFAGTRPPRSAARNEAAVPAREPRLGLLVRLDGWFTRQEQRQREAYLAQAQDIHDLERRMLHLERHGSF
jgi:hypothetical protein